MDLTYSFTREFVCGLLSLVLKDTSYGVRVASVIDPALMPTPSSKTLFSTLCSHVMANGSVPSIPVYKQAIYTQYDLGSIDDEVLRASNRLLDIAIKTEPLDRKDAHVVLKKTVLRSKVGDALYTSLKLYRAGEIADIDTLFAKAYSSVRSLDLGSFGFSSDHDFDDHVDAVRRGAAGVERIPTGVYPLDVAINGGLGRGELGCWLGGRKAGKSLLLALISSTAVLCGLTVVYITLELTELEMVIRMDGCLAGLGMNDIQRGGNKIASLLRERVSEILKRTHGRYVIKYFPPRTISVKDIDTFLNDLKSIRNVSPDVLIIDYADDLLASTKSGNDNSYVRGDHVYADLKAIGSSPDQTYGLFGGHNCAVWTVSQVQRDSMTDEIIHMSKIDKSIDKVSKVDFLGCFCKNEAEIESYMARLYVAACRYAPGNRGIEGEIGPYAQEEHRGRFFNIEEVEQHRSVELWHETVRKRMQMRVHHQTRKTTSVGRPLVDRTITGKLGLIID